MDRFELLLKKLKAFYGLLPSPPSDPFRLFVWEMLSWHSTPRKRDAAFAALKRMRALTPDAMWRTPQAKLEEGIALAGPYLEQRLHALRAGVDEFRRSPDLPDTIRGSIPVALKTLKALPQMGGSAGAYRMLLFAADHPVFPVDAPVWRTARRLGYGEATGNFRQVARSVRRSLATVLPETPVAYREAYLYLAHHGVTTCTEADPHCVICPLLADCSEGKARARR
jgi:endonuclease-3